jgi:ABC-type transport system substrate-binding protein
LLAAAGHPSGFEVTSSFLSGAAGGNAPQHAAVMDGMLADLGIKINSNPLAYRDDYLPLRDGRGQYEGWAYKATAGGATGGEPAGALANEYWSKSGVAFHGFDARGRADQSGDPQVDAIIEKARVERDTEKRRQLVYDLQRYLAKPWYVLPSPGLGTEFTLAWPCVGNFRVFEGARLSYGLWVDDSKPPFKSA